MIDLLQNKVISYCDLVQENHMFLYNYLSSECTRDAEKTVPKILDSLGIKKKVCIVIIQQTIEDTFLILEKQYGSNDQLKIFIVHSGNHFYLACPLFNSSKLIPPKVKIKPLAVPPKKIRPGSYESLDFGPPPDDFGMDDLAPCDDFFDFDF